LSAVWSSCTAAGSRLSAKGRGAGASSSFGSHGSRPPSLSSLSQCSEWSERSHPLAEMREPCATTSSLYPQSHRLCTAVDNPVSKIRQLLFKTLKILIYQARRKPP